MNPRNRERQLLQIIAQVTFLAASYVSSARGAVTSYPDSVPMGESGDMQDAQPIWLYEGEDVLCRVDARGRLDREQDRRDELDEGT